MHRLIGKDKGKKRKSDIWTQANVKVPQTFTVSRKKTKSNVTVARLNPTPLLISLYRSSPGIPSATASVKYR